MEYTITTNTQFNSLEVAFNGKPSETIREALKSLKFRWNPKKSIWYGYSTKESLESALNGQNVVPTKEEKNNHSLKVGDILFSCWGYEQTNNDFYQVVKTSKTCVWLIEVYLPILETKNAWAMAEDRRYDVEHVTPRYDDEKPFRRVVKNWLGDGLPEHESVSISSFQSASKYDGRWVYCSWYA